MPPLSQHCFEIKGDCGFENGKKLLLCGNGGSCAEMKNRPEIPEDYLNSLQKAVSAISLPSFTALNSAFCNDVDPALMFAQPIMGLGNAGDMLIAISTSGNSANAVAAALTAKALALKTIGLTGKSGGKLKEICDICVYPKPKPLRYRSFICRFITTFAPLLRRSSFEKNKIRYNYFFDLLHSLHLGLCFKA